MSTKSENEAQRKHDLAALKKFEANAEWQKMKEDFRKEAEGFRNFVIATYVNDYAAGVDTREEIKYTEKNRRMWCMERLGRVMEAVKTAFPGDHGAELFIEALEKRHNEHEQYVRKGQGGLITMANVVQYSDMDKSIEFANVLKAAANEPKNLIGRLESGKADKEGGNVFDPVAGEEE